MEREFYHHIQLKREIINLRTLQRNLLDPLLWIVMSNTLLDLTGL